MAIVKTAEGRSRVTAIVFIALALTSLGAPHVLLLSAGSAYLLTYRGIEGIALAYVLAAVILLPLGWAVMRFGRRLQPATLVLGVTAARAAVALSLALAAYFEFNEALSHAIYIWARVDLILGLMVFWRLAAMVFSGPADQRWMLWLAACEPVSTLLMGLFAPVISGLIGVAGMLGLAAIVLAAGAPPALLIRAELEGEALSERRGPLRRRSSAPRPLSPSLRRYFVLVIAAMSIWTIAHFLLDAMFHGLVGETVGDLVSRFNFVSHTLAAAGLIGLGFAFFGEGRLLRRYGVRMLLLILPTILVALAGLGLIGGVALGLDAALVIGVVAMKMIEFALVSGFYTRAWRSLFGPFPETHRNRLISVVSQNVQVGGAILAAVAIAAIFAARGFDAQVMAITFLAFSASGLLISVFVLRHYMQALERALVRRQSFGDVDFGGSDRRSREMIQSLLRQGDSEDVIEAARMQAVVDVDGFVLTAPRLIARGEADVVKTLLGSIPEMARPELYPPMAGRLTVEEDPALRDALLQAAASTGHPRSPRLLARAIAEAPEAPPMGALIGLGRHGGPYGAAVAQQFLERFATRGDEALNMALDAAGAIGPGAPPGPVALGLRSSDALVRRKAIRAAGKIGDPAVAQLLVGQLSDPREWRAATLSLSNLGRGAVEALAQAIGDRNLPLRQRAAAIRALGGIDESAAREQLLLHASGRDRRLRTHAQLALWRSGVVVTREQAMEFVAHAREEMRGAAEATLAAMDLEGAVGPVLIASLRQRAQRSAVCAVRAAGLGRQRPRDIELRLSALFGLSRDWKSAAVGARLLPPDLAAVFRHVDAPDAAGAREGLRRFVGLPQASPEEWLGHMLSGAEWATDWLSGGAYRELARIAPGELSVIDDLIVEPGPFLSDALREVAAERTKEGSDAMALSLIEKVLILKGADLFAHVPDEDLAEIAPYLTAIYLDPGETIIREGEIGDELYIVVTGEVAVLRDGEEVARRGDGAVFGELAALDPEPRVASVVATKPTQVLSLSNEHLLTLFESNVEIASGVISTLIRRLRSSTGY